MKRNFDHSKLVDAVLADESWRVCTAQLHANALAASRAARKSRARRTAVAQVLVLFVLLAAISWQFAKPDRARLSRTVPALANSSSTVARAKSAADKPASSHAPYITEDQMLAMFPQGSCILAEINGQKQLVFFQSSTAN